MCLRAVEYVKVAAVATHGNIRRALAIGVIPTVTVVDVVTVPGVSRHGYPEVGMHVYTGDSDESLRRTVTGELDVALLGLAEGVTPWGVQVREFSRERPVAVLAGGCRLAGRHRLHLEDLAGKTFADFPEGSLGREQSDLVFDRARLRH